jgi:hypothetical protein
MDLKEILNEELNELKERKKSTIVYFILFQIMAIVILLGFTYFGTDIIERNEDVHDEPIKDSLILGHNIVTIGRLSFVFLEIICFYILILRWRIEIKIKKFNDLIISSINKPIKKFKSS